MASKIKGMTVEIGGNTAPLEKALKKVNETGRDLQQELYEVNKLLKLDPRNTELVSQKQKILASMLENTTQKLGALKTAEKQAQDQFKDGKISEEQYRELQREIINTELKLKSLEKAAKETNGALSSDKALGNLKNIATGVAVAGAAAATAFAVVGSEAMKNADELKKQSDVTGISVERLQELQYIGNNLGVDLNTITDAQAKLTKSMAGAKDGTGAQADAFKALGINVVDSNGQLRDSKVVMEEAITALSTMTNETERDAMAQQIFGRGAMELNPLIKAGGQALADLTKEARENGAVMSGEAVDSLDTLGDSTENLKSAFTSLIGEALAKLAPMLTDIINALIQIPEWLKENETMVTVIAIAIGTLVAALIAYNVHAAWATIQTWAITTATTAWGAAVAFLTSPITLVVLAIGALIAVGVLLWKNWDFIGTKAKEIFGAIGKFIGGVFKGIANGWIDTVNFLIKALNFMIKAFLSPFNVLIKGWNDTVGKITGKIPEIKVAIPEIPKFEIGTRYLPKDMLIMAHEGEMIVPRNQNPYANSGGNVLPGADPKALALAIRQELERANIIAVVPKSNFEEAWDNRFLKVNGV